MPVDSDWNRNEAKLDMKEWLSYTEKISNLMTEAYPSNRDIMDKLNEVIFKLKEFEIKFDRVFGGHALIDSRFIDIYRKIKDEEKRMDTRTR